MDSQRDSQVADVAVPKAESQGHSPVDAVAVPSEAEMAIPKAVTSRLALLDVPVSDWNNRLRKLTMMLASMIPEVGKVASVILGEFWPEDKESIFDLIKKDIENLVDKKILEKEMEERKNEIGALRKVIEEYQAAKTHEKGAWLNRWIADSIDLYAVIKDSSNNIHMILPTITLALLHLSGMQERLAFGKEIYGEDNVVIWKKQLEDTYHEYVVIYFPYIFNTWKLWRADQVVIQKWTHLNENRAPVEDKVSGVKQEYCKDWDRPLYTFDSITKDLKMKLCNNAYTEMAGCLSTTFVFDKIVPSSQDLPYDKELFGCMFLGPYAEELVLGPTMVGDTRYSRKLDHNDYHDNMGSLKQMVIREYNTIDAMQFIYANGSGELAGNASGGREHKEDMMNKYVNGLRMGFSNGLLCFVQVLYIDGTKSIEFGNQMRWQTVNDVANGPPGYKLRSWSYGVNHGPSDTFGPGTLQLQYEVQL